MKIINNILDYEKKYFDKKILENYKNKSINCIKHFEYHDGCDNDDYLSNLYDIILFYEETNNYYIDIWHREDWFNNIIEDYRLTNNIKLPYKKWLLIKNMNYDLFQIFEIIFSNQ